jgi:hypothetical protein
MGLCPKQQTIPDPADAAVGGIEADQLLAPYNYLINAAAQMGIKYTDPDGVVHDFTGLGQADTAAVVSDQMAQTLLEIQREKSPAIIAQRLEELKIADPKGYEARQQLFDKIMADASANPDRPLSTATSQLIQDELAKGVGFSDNKQKQEVQDAVRGNQVGRGIYLGNTASSEEAKTVVGAGESLRNQRQQDALNLLQSGSAPEDVAYRQFQQTLANLGSFVNGQTPEAQFGQVSAANSGPVNFGTNGVNTNLFNPNAAGNGVSDAMQNFNTQQNYNQTQANPWLSSLSTSFNTVGTLKQINPSWFT